MSMRRPPSVPNGRRVLVVVGVVVFAVGMAATMAVSRWVGADQQQHERQRLEGSGRALTESVRIALSTVESRVNAVSGLLAFSEEVTQDEFEQFVGRLGLLGGLGGFGYAPLVDGEDLDDYLARMRESDPDYEVFGVTADGIRVPVETRAQHAPLQLFAPPEAFGVQPRGLDVMSEPIRRETVEGVERTGALAVTPFLYMYGQPDADGLVVFGPVVGSDGTVRGIITAPIDLRLLLDSQIPEGLHGTLTWEITDLADLQTVGTAIGAETAVWEEQVAFGGRLWRIDVASPEATAGAVSFSGYWFSLPVGVAGSLISALLVGLWVQRAQVSRERRHRTADAESEKRFRDLFEEAPIGYLSIGEAGEIIQVNRRCAELLGSTPDEMLGRPIVDFYPRTLPGKVDAQERRERWLATGELRAEEFQIRRADGELRWVRATASSIVGPEGRPAASRSLWEDVTEQKETEGALRRAEARFRAAFENAPIGMQLSTADGRFLEVNPALCRMLGYSEEQLLEMKVGEVVHPDDRGRYMLSRGALFAGEVDQIEAVNRFRRSDGSLGWCRIGATRPNVDEGYVVTQVVDITGLVEAQERLSGLMGEKDRFIATVSHELRTPLAGAVGFAAELRDRAARFSAAEVAEFAGLIAEGCETARKLVEDLLMAARIDRGDIDFLLEGTDLRSEAVTVITEPGVAALRGERSVAVEGEPAVAWADPHRVRQILRNLMVNALQHGGQEVTVRCGVRLESQEAYTQVCDNGAGVSGELAGTLFQPYQHGRREGQTESVGLGLYLSRNLAHLMGGDIVYSRADGKTVFELSLPVPGQSAAA
jgi:PAS domain S-box-containing protein